MLCESYDNVQVTLVKKMATDLPTKSQISHPSSRPAWAVDLAKLQRLGFLGTHTCLRQPVRSCHFLYINSCGPVHYSFFRSILRRLT
jgi:hypothetical protein